MILARLLLALVLTAIVLILVVEWLANDSDQLKAIAALVGVLAFVSWLNVFLPRTRRHY